MELHSPVAAKRLWNFLRVAFFMMRKGLISKRKLIMDMNLIMKRGKLLRKSLGNLVFHHHHHSKSAAASRGFGLQEYEFSCSNSPNPLFFHMSKRKQLHHHFSSFAHFPCINVQDEPDDAEEPKAVAVLPQIEFSPDCSHINSGAEKYASPMVSPFSVRVSNFSWEDENDRGVGNQVDNEAAEFIRRFYEQLRVQRRTALLEYQESQYQEMIARGAH